MKKSGPGISANIRRYEAIVSGALTVSLNGDRPKAFG
jgi:hypothetical protein